MGSDFAREVKEIGNWRTTGWAENTIDDLGRPVHNHNTPYQNNKASRKAALKTIESKWGREKAEYIRQYNHSKKYAKIVRKTCLRWSWEQARELVTKSVLQRLERITKHVTLSCLIINGANISEPGVNLPSKAPVDKRKLERLKVTIMEL